MPIDWKAADSAQRLLAVVMIAHNIKRPDYRRMAMLYGQGATYDSIESRFRPIRALMKRILEDLEERGVDLGALPRGRGQGTEPTAKLPPKEPDVKHETSIKTTSSIATAAGSPSSSKKRTTKPATTRERKKIKKEPNNPQVIDLCRSDSEQTDGSEEDEDPVRSSRRRPQPVSEKLRPQPQPVVLIRQSEQAAAIPAAGNVGSYDTTCDSYSASDDENILDPRYGTEDDSDDPPLPPGRRARQRQAPSKQYGAGFAVDESRPFWHSFEGSDAQSFSFAGSSPLPSSPTINRQTTFAASANTSRPFAPKLNLDSYGSHPGSFSSMPPSEKLYREPDTRAYPSTTTSLSNENAPFLPQRTASRSSSSHLTRFSPVPAFRPTSADFEAPEAMAPSNYLKGLDIAADDSSIPWSPVLSTGAARGASRTNADGGPARVDLKSAQRPSSKSTTMTSKSGSGNSNTDARSQTMFSSPERTRPSQGHQQQHSSNASSRVVGNEGTQHAQTTTRAAPQQKRKLFKPPAWSAAAQQQQASDPPQPFYQHSSSSPLSSSFEQQRHRHGASTSKVQPIAGSSSSNTGAKIKPPRPRAEAMTATAKVGVGSHEKRKMMMEEEGEEEEEEDPYRHYKHVPRVRKENNPMGLLFPKTIHYA